MDFPLVKEEKRYCLGGEELLRAVITMPDGLNGEEMQGLTLFLSELSRRSLDYCEGQLFPIVQEEYETLSPHDRKFKPPRLVYRVTVTLICEEDKAYGEVLRMSLSVQLRRRGRNEFETQIERKFAKYGKKNVYQMIHVTKSDRKLRKRTRA